MMMVVKYIQTITFKNNNDLWKNSGMEADYFDGNVAKAQMKGLARVAGCDCPRWH